MPDSNTDKWQPIGQNHAIDIMAAVINYTQPFPDLLFRKVLKQTEEVAFSLGLNSRHPVALQVIGPQPPANVAVPNLQGMTYNSIQDGEGGTAAPGKITEQLQILPSAIIYRTWRYVSWSWQLKRMEALFRPILDAARDTIAINVLRLEYLDRFHRALSGSPDTAALIRRNCPYVPPFAFETSEMWHCHTGAFVGNQPPKKRLKVVNIDIVDEQASAPGAPPVRWSNITTAFEDRIEATDTDNYLVNAEFISETLKSMHADLKILLAEIITDEIAKRIYLNGSD